MCVSKRQTGETEKLQGAEVVKVDKFKYLEVKHSKQRKVHRTGEEESAGRVEWVETSIEGEFAARVKRKVYKMVVKPALM